MENTCEQYPIRHIDSKDIPVYDGDNLPSGASLLMFVTQKDQQCGEYLPFVYKLPTVSILPAGNDEGNTTTLAGNGAEITVPDKQVRAGYVFNNSPNDIRLADNSAQTKAMFLILGRDKTNTERYDIAVDGIYKFPNGHNYVVGYTYYLGLNGQPVTNRTSQKLFDVLDNTRIRIHLEEA